MDTDAINNLDISKLDVNNLNLNNLNMSNLGITNIDITQIAIYLYMTVCIVILAYKMGVDNKLMAYFPGVNVILLCDMAQISPICAAIILIPNWVVQTLFMTFLWMRILDSSAQPKWHAIFLIIPGINLIYITYLVSTY